MQSEPEPVAEQEALAPLPDGYRAVVLGSTGAIGRELVAELVSSTKCGSVVAVTRRVLAEGVTCGKFPAEHVGACFPRLAASVQGSQGLAKLEIAVVDWEALCSGAAHNDLFAGAHFVACCLGTSRAAEGGKAGFERCDLDYTSAAAQLARDAGCPQYTLVTSKGASATSYIFYMKIKGKQEVAAKALGFPRLTIFQPGALNRGDELRKQRNAERFMGFIGMTGIDVALVGRALMVDAEQRPDNSEQTTFVVYGDGDIRRLAAM